MEHVTRPSLRALGWTDRRISTAVRSGELTRIRAGHFAVGTMDEAVCRAIRVGGRLACVSELRHRNVWVLDGEEVHVHVADNASRQRADPRGSRRHWHPLDHPDAADASHVGMTDALIQASRCLERREWIASVDSALHQKKLFAFELGDISPRVSSSHRGALRLVDARAESGLESIVRLIALDLGFRVRSQVRVPGVGRVDLVIEDWIVVETDGSAFHDSSLAARDRARDAALAARSRTVLRPGYSLIIFDRPAVARQLIGAVRAHRRVKESGRIADRARRRLDKWSAA